MSTQHDDIETSPTALELVTDELRDRITTVEIELAHWERTCQALSAELREIAPQCGHCRTRPIANEDDGRPE